MSNPPPAASLTPSARARLQALAAKWREKCQWRGEYFRAVRQCADELEAALLAEAERPAWQPMETAPKEKDYDRRVDVLLRFKDTLTAWNGYRRWAGRQMVGHWTPHGWYFSGPTGYGGFTDNDFEGWMPLPLPAPPLTAPETKE